MCFSHSASQCRGRYGQSYAHASSAFGPWARHFAEKRAAFFAAPVNLREKKDWYELYLYAPGLNKDAFEVQVSDDVLSIRFKAQDGQQSEGADWLFREYADRSFERRFQLNGKVDTSGISARYTDGVLELTLPKTPGATGQSIAVA
ncbi:MAG TPA: Hsp20/alpha crystallin family protein [Saprospiraceae bacterium]|nr:Hsp20/alpha crystallin family protein [Saprospiraceae bacterium]